MSDRGLNAFLKETIIEAGVLLRSFSKPEKVAESDFDLVMSRFIIDAIRRMYPDHRCISEEEQGTDEDGDALTWIIDPIDGSDNFYRGFLSYAISMSLVHGDDILLGAVYEPYNDRLFFSEKGKGATLNGQAIRVSSTSNMKAAVVAVSRYPSFTRNGAEEGLIFHRLVEKLDVRICASTALDMCNVAAGVIEGRIMADMRSWDNSAATLLVREAGGLVTDWNGGNHSLSRSRKLVASNGLCHRALLDFLDDS